MVFRQGQPAVHLESWDQNTGERSLFRAGFSRRHLIDSKHFIAPLPCFCPVYWKHNGSRICGTVFASKYRSLHGEQKAKYAI
jgi:hypothetical protein